MTDSSGVTHIMLHPHWKHFETDNLIIKQVADDGMMLT